MDAGHPMHRLLDRMYVQNNQQLAEILPKFKGNRRHGTICHRITYQAQITAVPLGPVSDPNLKRYTGLGAIRSLYMG